MLLSTKYHSIPVSNLTLQIFKDLGPAAICTYYKDGKDPSPLDCRDEYWNDYYMERTAAINLNDRFDKMRPSTVNVPVYLWMLIKKYYRQPIILLIPQELVNFRVKASVTFTTIRNVESIYRTITKISKELRTSRKINLQTFYDENNTEWIATKPDWRKRDSPIIRTEANDITGTHFFQFGGAIPKSSITNEEEFDKNKECMKSASGFMLITCCFMSTQGTTDNREYIVQLQLASFTASINVGKSGKKTGGNYLFNQPKTLYQRQSLFKAVLTVNGCHIHVAFFLNKFGQFWMESRLTHLSPFHMVLFHQNPAQSEETKMIIERGTGGEFELNEITSINGDTCYPLPECSRCIGRHSHSTVDTQCYGARKEMNDVYRHLYNHFLLLGYEPGLNVINKKDVEQFTKELEKEFKTKLISQSIYLERFHSFFNLTNCRYRTPEFVNLLEFRDIKNVHFMGENRAVKYGKRKYESDQLQINPSMLKTKGDDDDDDDDPLEDINFMKKKFDEKEEKVKARNLTIWSVLQELSTNSKQEKFLEELLEDDEDDTEREIVVMSGIDDDDDGEWTIKRFIEDDDKDSNSDCNRKTKGARNPNKNDRKRKLINLSHDQETNDNNNNINTVKKLGNENESLLLSSNTCCTLSVQQPFPKKRKLEEERASTTSSKSSANI